MTFRRFLRLLISSFNHIPKILANKKISWLVEIRGNSLIRGCQIGSYSYVAPGCNIQNAHIGNYVSIAPDVHIGGMEHAILDLSTSTWLSDRGVSFMITTIQHDVWIAAGSIIKQGVTIGQGAVIGANSFVNKDVPPYAIVVGSPAKIIKYRFPNDIIIDLLESDYFKMSPNCARAELQKIRCKNIVQLKY